MAAVLELSLSSEKDCSLVLSEAEIEKTICLVLEQEEVSRSCSVSVSLVTEEKMQELNYEWRGVARPTDVLSLECERPTDPDLAPGEPCELGDIVLAPHYIARQAQELNTPLATETRLLLIHATLHLLGYDHLEEAEAVRMEKREDELLALLCNIDAHVQLTRHREENA